MIGSCFCANGIKREMPVLWFLRAFVFNHLRGRHTATGYQRCYVQPSEIQALSFPIGCGSSGYRFALGAPGVIGASSSSIKRLKLVVIEGETGVDQAECSVLPAGDLKHKISRDFETGACGHVDQVTL